MRNTLIATAVGAALLMISATAHALRLGELKVHSAIHRPLQAEVSLQSMAAEGLKINLSPSDMLGTQGRSDIYGHLQHQVHHNGYVGPTVNIATDQPISENYLNFFLAAESSTGARDIREYTLALNMNSDDAAVINGGLQIDLSQDLLPEVHVTEIEHVEISTTASPEPAAGRAAAGSAEQNEETPLGVIVEIPTSAQPLPELFVKLQTTPEFTPSTTDSVNSSANMTTSVIAVDELIAEQSTDTGVLVEVTPVPQATAIPNTDILPKDQIALDLSTQVTATSQIGQGNSAIEMPDGGVALDLQSLLQNTEVAGQPNKATPVDSSIVLPIAETAPHNGTMLTQPAE